MNLQYPKMSNNSLLTRRRALRLGLATLTCMGAYAQGKSIARGQQAQTLEDSEREFTVVGEASLKERAAAKGLIYGGAGGFEELLDESYADAVKRECDILVVGNELKWDKIHPSQDKFDFEEGDWLVEFARDRGMLFRGHTLVWHQAVPDWLKNTIDSQNAEQLMVNHIREVAGHYAGKMHSWDVVNEALDDGEFRKTLWLDNIGPEYIDIAFRAAHEADSQAMLVYNEIGIEHDAKQREGVLKLLEELKAKGTPVHALGIQGHIWAVGYPNNVNYEELRQFLSEVASLGLKILITEMDVIDSGTPAGIETRDRLIATIYEDFLSVALDEPAVTAVLTWGLSDRYTWINSHFPRSDGLPSRPLPLDEQMNRKLAWKAMARAFDSAPSRSADCNQHCKNSVKLAGKKN